MNLTEWLSKLFNRSVEKAHIQPVVDITFQQMEYEIYHYTKAVTGVATHTIVTVPKGEIWYLDAVHFVLGTSEADWWMISSAETPYGIAECFVHDTQHMWNWLPKVQELREGFSIKVRVSVDAGNNIDAYLKMYKVKE